MADHVDIDKHVRTYMIVFGALLVLTVITVTVAFLELPTWAAVGVALLIASIKGGLVACYFMHLISEKKFIYWALGVTVFFFFGLLLLPVLTDLDKITNL